MFKNYFSLKLKNLALNDQVNFIIDFFQTCTEVYDLLNNGDFGASGQKAVENYRKSCHEIFPLATKFSLEQPQHHVNNNSVNSDKSSKLKSNDEIEPWKTDVLPTVIIMCNAKKVTRKTEVK